jgi:hypothetical protein
MFHLNIRHLESFVGTKIGTKEKENHTYERSRVQGTGPLNWAPYFAIRGQLAVDRETTHPDRDPAATKF